MGFSSGVGFVLLAICVLTFVACADGAAFKLDVGPTGSKAKIEPPVVADEGLEVVEIDAPGTLKQSNTKYVLTRDVTSPGTAFTIDAGVTNCILDLGGHVVTYNAEKKEGVPGKPYSECVYGVSIGGRGVQNIVIRNGTILQGKGGNAGSHAIRISGGNSVEITRLQLRVHGPSSCCVSAGWGGPDGRVHDNYMENRSRGTRRGLFSPDGVTISQTQKGWHIYNNTIIGGHRSVAVWSNALKDHDSNAEIHHNRLSPTRVHGLKAPQGIICFGAAGNHIYENQISTDDARGINLQGRGSGGNQVHHNLIACRYSTRATEGNYVENRCYGYWERDGNGNRLHHNLWIVGNEVKGDRTSNSIGILATTTGGRLKAAEFTSNRFICRHVNPDVDVLGFVVKRSDKDVVVDGNEIVARTAAIRVWQKSEGVQIRNNVWFKTPEIPADAPMLTGDSVETSILKDNRAVALATDGKVPKPPRALRAIPRFEAIELRWQPNAAKDVVGYHVYCDGKRITPYAVGGWFWVHTALKTGEKHRYMVVAVNLWDREGARSEAIEAPAP